MSKYTYNGWKEISVPTLRGSGVSDIENGLETEAKAANKLLSAIGNIMNARDKNDAIKLARNIFGDRYGTTPSVVNPVKSKPRKKKPVAIAAVDIPVGFPEGTEAIDGGMFRLPDGTVVRKKNEQEETV